MFFKNFLVMSVSLNNHLIFLLSYKIYISVYIFSMKYESYYPNTFNVHS